MAGDLPDDAAAHAFLPIIPEPTPAFTNGSSTTPRTVSAESRSLSHHAAPTPHEQAALFSRGRIRRKFCAGNLITRTVGKPRRGQRRIA